MATRKPPAFGPEKEARAIELAEQGLTDQEIARELGCGTTTLYTYLRKEPRFVQALKTAKRTVDERVKRSLLERALGYTYTDQQAIKIKAPDGERVEVVEVTKHVPPDTTAMIFWLKNRDPAEWRDKTVQEHEGGVTHSVTVVTGVPGPADDLV